jgi:uracil-DNA glycosylase family 4
MKAGRSPLGGERWPGAREPDRYCPLCPRLVEFRNASQRTNPSWHNAPVPSFGVDDPRLVIVGLAPGLRGANRTGRPFTGDYAGDLLYETLIQFGFATGVYRADPADGVELVDCLITNAVRCVPPENKPTPVEISQCRPFLAATIASLPNLRAILVLGRIAHDSTLRTLGLKLAAYPFAHGARHDVKSGAVMFDSFHCSRYNTNTRRLTPEMFKSVFADIRKLLDAA